MSQATATSRPYSVEVPFRWSDLDAYQHVNNVQLVRMLEDARVLGFAEWYGQDRTLLETGVLVAHHSIDYLRPMTYHYRPALVSMWCSRISAASFDLAYEVREAPGRGPGAIEGAGRDDVAPDGRDTGDGGADTVYCVAETVLAAYDLAGGRTRRLSEDEVTVLRRYLGEPAPLRRRTRA